MKTRAHRAEPNGVARVVCEQIEPIVGDRESNFRLVIEAVERAIKAHADIVVLPELATSGYMFSSMDEARSLAIPDDDPFFGSIAAALGGTDTIVVVGFCELGPRATLYNSAALVTSSGVSAVYRKTHLWDRETLFFTPGEHAPPVISTIHGRVGIAVCYDLEFSEVPRQLALAGADLIAVPTNWPRGDHPADERCAEIIIAQAAARTNGVFIAICDRRGVERGQAWNEGSVIIDQFGWVQSAASASSADQFAYPAAVADIFPLLARDKAISPHNSLLADRRPDIYSSEVPLYD